jgi:signal peptidase I
VLGVAGALAVFVWAAGFKPYGMTAASMQPNAQSGDYLVVMRRAFSGPPRRGDIVAFYLPSSGKVVFVKRLIGMPGDQVQLRGGQLFLNGRMVTEMPIGPAEGDLPGGRGPVRLVRETTPEGRSYRIQLSPGFEFAGDTGVYAVPAHCYFVLGDNRDNSLDSRFDPGVDPNDSKLGGCGWDATLDQKVGDQAGVGFVPEANLLGVVTWDAGRILPHRSEDQ